MTYPRDLKNWHGRVCPNTDTRDYRSNRGGHRVPWEQRLTVPESLPPGSDVGTMSLFGYDPLQFHTGRAPIEAAAQGIELGPDDWAIRCNFVTLNDGKMESFTAHQIPNDEGRELIELLQKECCGDSNWNSASGSLMRNVNGNAGLLRFSEPVYGLFFCPAKAG